MRLLICLPGGQDQFSYPIIASLSIDTPTHPSRMPKCFVLWPTLVGSTAYAA